MTLELNPLIPFEPRPIPARLYHGGAPGFRPGDVIEPAPTHRVDGCAYCESGADDSHRPDLAFATSERLYGRFYASKYIRGWLYAVRPAPGARVVEMSEYEDPFPSWGCSALVVDAVLDRVVELTMSERRRLWRMWKARDQRLGLGRDAEFDMGMERLLGIRPPLAR